MDIIRSIVQILAAVSGCLAAFLSIPLFLKLHWPAPMLWGLKLFASAISPLLALIGLICLIAGLTSGSVFISLIGLYVFMVFSIHIIRVSRPAPFPGSFEQAFGTDWKNRIAPAQKKLLLPNRFILSLPVVPEPMLEQNIIFSRVPGSERNLFCDVWQPAPTVCPSGLVFIYLHGSAFYFLDKDLGTRPFFRHLAAQGHLVMDVAYRLSPETDIMGMVNDVQRAIVWIRKNAGRYGIDPERIVLGGGSAGGHLALLTAYTRRHPRFISQEFEGKDLSVCAVISIYGTTDLEAVYYHTNQHLTTRAFEGKPKKPVPTKIPGWLKKWMGEDYHRLGMDKGLENAGALAPLLGGHPEERPEAYAFFSPVNHVHSECPPTLLIHGEDDIMAPVQTTRLMHSRLREAKVPAILHILPQTDHAFDMMLPKISPAAHNAIYDVDHFIALMV